MSEEEGTPSKGPPTALDRGIATLTAINTVIGLLVSIIGFKACDEVVKTKEETRKLAYDILEGQTATLGRLSTSTSFDEMEGKFAEPHGVYGLLSTLTVNVEGAQPITITEIEHQLWMCEPPSIQLPDAGSALAITLPPEVLGPHTEVDGGAGLWTQAACWHMLDRQSVPTPGCDAFRTPVPSAQCRLDGVGTYTRGETAISSAKWRVALPRDSVLVAYIRVSWCKYDAPLDDSGALQHEPSACLPQNAWTFAKDLELCGSSDYD